MDVDAIRSRFIQDTLRAILEARNDERDRERARQALRAFRLYFHWFEAHFPDLERLSILTLLARLEEESATPPSDDSPHLR